jgi:tetratricopeptide (TPR) repeat protein
MRRLTFPMVLAALVCGLLAVSVSAQQPDENKNLKVLPKDISHDELIGIMGGFTRALGVRCIHCHVGEEGKPFKPGAFALDDKPTKLKARAMMRMVQDLNDKYLADLDHRSDPPIRVECFTCHHGVAQPRTLQGNLEIAYQEGGLDSTVARYNHLRDRYYGSAAYDFGEVPLSDVADSLRRGGHDDDATKLLSLNVELNPKSSFAKRRFAASRIIGQFANAGADSGAAAYHDLAARYGANVVNEDMLNGIGYRLLAMKRMDAAVAAFKLNVVEHPQSGDTYDSLGEAYALKGDRKLAIESYTKAVALDSTNTNAKEKLQELRPAGKASKGGKHAG